MFREMILSTLLCPGEMTPGGLCAIFEYPVQALIEQIQKRVTKMICWLKRLSDEERLRKLALFNLKNRRFQGEFTVAFQCINEVSCPELTKDNSFRLKESRFRSNKSRKFF